MKLTDIPHLDKLAATGAAILVEAKEILALREELERLRQEIQKRKTELGIRETGEQRDDA